MFEYTLENGKHQFKMSFIYLCLDLLLGIITAILNFVLIKYNPEAVQYVNVALGILIGVCFVLFFIKLIFGAVVYHAERIASKDLPKPK